MSHTRSQKALDNELEDEIARLAYELWAQDGYTHGNHGKHWLEAERQLRGTRKVDTAPAYSPQEQRDGLHGSTGGGVSSRDPSRDRKTDKLNRGPSAA